jgi:phosphopantetheine adenylyltransferase
LFVSSTSIRDFGVAVWPAASATPFGTGCGRGATVTWAKANGIQALVRGLRTASDLENEAPMAAIHRSHGFETLFLVCDPALSHISSRLIRSVLAAGLPTDALMSGRTLDAIRRWSVP